MKQVFCAFPRHTPSPNPPPTTNNRPHQHKLSFDKLFTHLAPFHPMGGTMLSIEECRQAVIFYRRLPPSWSKNRRHEEVARQLSYTSCLVDRRVHRNSVARALERW